MKVLYWQESKDQFVAVVQPPERFLAGSFFESDRYEYESIISGRLKVTGEEDIFAHAFDKRWCSLEEAQRLMEQMRDYLTEIQAREMVEQAEEPELALAS
jgi:hypothetical protein